MINTKKTDGIDRQSRVVLNLTTEQAQNLANTLRADCADHPDEKGVITGIILRLEKTITKQRILKENPEFKGAQLRTAVQYALTGKDAIEFEVIE